MKTRFVKRKIATIAGCTVLVFGLSACQADNNQSTGSTEANVESTTPAVNQSSAVETESAKVNAFFERVFEESVARSPEALTRLGRKERADEWNDLSKAFSCLLYTSPSPRDS